MFLNLDDFGKCSPVSMVARIPAVDRSVMQVFDCIPKVWATIGLNKSLNDAFITNLILYLTRSIDYCIDNNSFNINRSMDAIHLLQPN